MKWLTWRQELGNPECVYAERWILKLPFIGWSIRLHHFLKSDDARAHHDHPWWFWTLVLKGSYVDEAPCPECADSDYPGRDPETDKKCWACHGTAELRDRLSAGSVRFRPAEWQHTLRTNGVWTIVLTGTIERKWGFWEVLADGRKKFRKANKWFFMHGHHPCDQP